MRFNVLSAKGLRFLLLTFLFLGEGLKVMFPQAGSVFLRGGEVRVGGGGGVFGQKLVFYLKGEEGASSPTH